MGVRNTDHRHSTDKDRIGIYAGCCFLYIKPILGNHSVPGFSEGRVNEHVATKLIADVTVPPRLVPLGVAGSSPSVCHFVLLNYNWEIALYSSLLTCSFYPSAAGWQTPHPAGQERGAVAPCTHDQP